MALLKITIYLLMMLRLCCAAQAYSTHAAGPSKDLPEVIGRRTCFGLAINAFIVPTAALAAPSPSSSSPIEGMGGSMTRRIEGIGGALDIQIITREPDVLYPPSIAGVWQCQRVITKCEGDTFQAQQAWSALGGFPDDKAFFKEHQVETFLTKFNLNKNKSATTLDRAFEIVSRGANAAVEVTESESPNILRYKDMKTGQMVELAVVERRAEPVTDQGFGFDELVRISFGGIQRAARVKRRYRRAFDGDGNRVIEGLEILKTYRVLDGVAGIEMPTSTTKSQIQMKRPS